MRLQLSSANYFINTTITTIPITPIQLSNTIEYAAKIPSEERVWFRDY